MEGARKAVLALTQRIIDNGGVLDKFESRDQWRGCRLSIPPHAGHYGKHFVRLAGQKDFSFHRPTGLCGAGVREILKAFLASTPAGDLLLRMHIVKLPVFHLLRTDKQQMKKLLVYSAVKFVIASLFFLALSWLW